MAKAGRRVGRGLFKQYADEYTEFDNPDIGKYDLIEFHETFLAEADPTEYKPAMKLMGSWAEWNRLKYDWPTFSEHVEAWKEELDIKLKSEAIEKLQSLKESASDATAASICKFLAQGSYNKRAGAGRPSDAEVTKQQKAIAKQASETDEDGKRVFEALREMTGDVGKDGKILQ